MFFISLLGHRSLETKNNQKQYCKHLFALLAALLAIGQHSKDEVFPLIFRRKGLSNHDKSTPTHFFEKDATNLSWPEVIDALFLPVDKKRKYVQAYNKFQSEVPLTKKQKKAVESAKPVEQQVFTKMTVADLRRELKDSFDVIPKSTIRKPELIDLALCEFRKRKEMPTTAVSLPLASPRSMQPLNRAQPYSEHQLFSAQLSQISPNARTNNNNNNNSPIIRTDPPPLFENSISSAIVTNDPLPEKRLIVKLKVAPKK